MSLTLVVVIILISSPLITVGTVMVTYLLITGTRPKKRMSKQLPLPAADLTSDVLADAQELYNNFNLEEF